MFNRTLIHVNGCGKPAFHVQDNVRRGTDVKASDIQNLDGTFPKMCDIITCGSCGKGLGNTDLQVEFLVPRRD